MLSEPFSYLSSASWSVKVTLCTYRRSSKGPRGIIKSTTAASEICNVTTYSQPPENCYDRFRQSRSTVQREWHNSRILSSGFSRVVVNKGLAKVLFGLQLDIG